MIEFASANTPDFMFCEHRSSSCASKSSAYNFFRLRGFFDKGILRPKGFFDNGFLYQEVSSTKCNLRQTRVFTLWHLSLFDSLMFSTLSFWVLLTLASSLVQYPRGPTKATHAHEFTRHHLIALWFYASKMEKSSGTCVLTFIIPSYPWKNSMVIIMVMVNICSLLSLCCFCSKIYLPSVYISHASNNWTFPGYTNLVPIFMRCLYFQVCLKRR